MWILPPKVRRPLLKGLRSAFPDISEFDSFLLTNCSKERADIVPDTVNIGYPNQIERVLRNAEYKNWSNLLINKACEEQPTNEYLQNAKQLFDAYNAKGLVARVPIDVFSIFQRYSIPILFCCFKKQLHLAISRWSTSRHRSRGFGRRRCDICERTGGNRIASRLSKCG